jgi:hypothetical protein
VAEIDAWGTRNWVRILIKYTAELRGSNSLNSRNRRLLVWLQSVMPR